MNSFVKNIAVASAVSLMAIGSAGAVSAQSSGDNASIKVDTQSKWRFDSNRHERRHHRDDQFRFYFGGFWYPQPYWQGYGLAIGPRISCGEGRAILRDRGFYRVRIIECSGRTYTYFGHRHGDSFRVLLNSRNGRIVGVNPS
jgi:hypothetical protein